MSDLSVPSEFPAIGWDNADRIPAASDKGPFRVNPHQPVPKPKTNEVLIHVYSSSYNPIDAKQARTNVNGQTGFSAAGFDIAGIIAEVGPETNTSLQVGDRVFAYAYLNGSGGWSNDTQLGGFTLAHITLVCPLPSRVPFLQAGVVPIAFLSVYDAFSNASIWEGFDKAHDFLFIPGGTGAVNHFGIQYLHCLGVQHIITSVSTSKFTAANLDLLKQWGATHIFDHTLHADYVDYIYTHILPQSATITGHGVKIVYNSTYNIQSFLHSAQCLQANAHSKFILLGSHTLTPEISHILQQKKATFVIADTRRYFMKPEEFDKTGLGKGLPAYLEFYEKGAIQAHISRVVEGVDELNAVATGQISSDMGKIAVLVKKH